MRAIKFKNNDFLDSTGIVHNKNSLSEMISSFHGNEEGGLCVKQRIINCDFNELWKKGTGMFIAYASVKNAPHGNETSNVHFYVLQFVYNEKYILQIAVPLHGETSFLSMRNKVNGVWESWKRLEFKAW